MCCAYVWTYVWPLNVVFIGMWLFLMYDIIVTSLLFICCRSYEEALQALADSEAKKETTDRELRLVSVCVCEWVCVCVCVYAWITIL